MLEQIEVAVVASRPDLNAQITAQCLRKDVYVFSEKPLAVTMEQLQMLEAAQKEDWIYAMTGFASWVRKGCWKASAVW